jgi:hypothetical protein
MIQKAFDDITKADIDFLIENKIAEFKTLEYKEKLPGSTDKDKKEFLADIASFANTSGGDIIYGIKAAVDSDGKKTGAPEKVVPLQGKNSDEAKLMIENIIRTGIAPRISVHVKEITGCGDDSNGFIILVRIPQSFASPHLVTSKSSPFFCRNSAGKYPLDVQEIRSAFLATDSQADRIRSFIQNRLAKIMADETPMKLSAPHRLVLHVLPLNSFLNKKRLDLSNYQNLSSNFHPIGVSGWDHRYNLDGCLMHRSCRETKLCESYCQLFFDGSIEAACTNILNKSKNGSGTVSIPSVAYELWIVRALESYFKGYKTLGIEAPIIISMTLLGCKGVYLYSDYTDEPIDRDVAIFPETQTDSLDKDVPTIMKPIFDAVWNACGAARSCNYTEDGIWNVRQL